MQKAFDSVYYLVRKLLKRNFFFFPLTIFSFEWKNILKRKIWSHYAIFNSYYTEFNIIFFIDKLDPSII